MLIEMMWTPFTEWSLCFIYQHFDANSVYVDEITVLERRDNTIKSVQGIDCLSVSPSGF